MVWLWDLPSWRFIPERQSLGGLGPWSGHLPFACDLVANVKPSLLVELGTFYGESYFGFCQSVKENSLRCECYAVDTWRGDEHGGYYGDEIYDDVQDHNRAKYAPFSHLLRMTFDEALNSFTDESIDILHIDGYHTYDAVVHDFQSWFPKVRPGGILLFHDISIRARGFGVYRFWAEVRDRFSSFSFTHSAGLGVLVKPGGAGRADDFISTLVNSSEVRAAVIGDYYARAGEVLRAMSAAAEDRKRIMSSPLCRVQVFYPCEHGYTEDNSVSQTFEAGRWQRIRFQIPTPSGRQPLRFDPADEPCIAEIKDISVYAADSRERIWSWVADSSVPGLDVGGTGRLLPTPSGFAIVSDGADPQVFLTGFDTRDCNYPITVEINCRITACLRFKGRLVPVGVDGHVADELLSSAELDRAFLREEIRSSLAHLRTDLLAWSLSAERRVSSLEGDVKHVASEFSALTQVIADLSSTCGSDREALCRLVSHLEGVSERLRQRDEEIRHFMSQLKHVDEQLHDRDEEIRHRDTELKEREREIRQCQLELERIRTTLSEELQQMRDELARSADALTAERGRREELERSWSWWVTAPARRIVSLGRRNRG